MHVAKQPVTTSFFIAFPLQENQTNKQHRCTLHDSMRPKEQNLTNNQAKFSSSFEAQSFLEAMNKKRNLEIAESCPSCLNKLAK